MARDLTIFVSILAVIIGGLLFFTGVLEPTLEDSKLKQYDEYVAKCDRQIKAILRAPSTAKIEYYGFTTGTGKASKFSVLARVDSQNGFGAMIRSNMKCSSICAVSGDYMSCGRIEIEQ